MGQPSAWSSAKRQAFEDWRARHAEQRHRDFWDRVDQSDGPLACWPWKGRRTAQDYGAQVSFGGPRLVASRLAYLLTWGSIPSGFQIDHLCRNPPCCNPSHLEAVTSRENTMRGTTIAAREAARTHCIHGHPLDGDNLIVRRRPRGGRACRLCMRAHCRDYYQREKARST